MKHVGDGVLSLIYLTAITKYHANLLILFLRVKRVNIFRLVKFLQVGAFLCWLNLSLDPVNTFHLENCEINMALDLANSGHFENNAQNISWSH